MTFTRGDVVALRRSGVGIVWAAKGDDVWIFPVSGANGPPRHRSEVRFDDLADIAACGVSLRFPAVRCDNIQKFSLKKLPGERLGHTPVGLMARIVRAIAREKAAQAAEASYRFMDLNSGRKLA